MELREPKRKRRVQVKSHQPFPVPIQSFAEDSIFSEVWRMYVGRYSGNNVIISDPEDMTALNRMGFFGKGSLSRSVPVFGKWKMDTPPLVYNRQWKRRCDWAKSCNNTTDKGNENPKSTDGRNSDIVECRQSNRKNAVKSVLKKETDDDLVVERFIKSGIESQDLVKRGYLQARNSENINATNSIESTENDQKQGQTVIVLADSDCDSGNEDYLLNLNPRLEQEEFRIQETLQLTLEEAFFLNYGLGCLQVQDLSGNELSSLELWKLFCRSQPDFVVKYVAYHYFRSKGWVVKPGIKFGGDFLLYKQGPAFYHASYIVHVHVVSIGGIYESLEKTFSWTQYIGLNRLAETAGKEILLCSIVWPPDVSRPESTKSPKVLEKFTVHEVLMRRWVSSQEREEQNDDDDDVE